MRIVDRQPPGLRRAGQGDKVDDSTGNDTKSAAGADGELGRINAPAVLAQRPPSSEQRRLVIGGNELGSEYEAAHRAVTQHPTAARVGGDHPPERRVGAEVDGQLQAMFGGSRVEFGQSSPGAHRCSRLIGVDRHRRAQPFRRQDHGRRVGGRHGAADEPGIGTLGKQANTIGHTAANDIADLFDSGRRDDEGSPAAIAAGRLLEAGDVVDAGHEDRRQPVEQRGEGLRIHLVVLARAWSRGNLGASLAGVIPPM